MKPLAELLLFAVPAADEELAMPVTTRLLLHRLPDELIIVGPLSEGVTKEIDKALFSLRKAGLIDHVEGSWRRTETGNDIIVAHSQPFHLSGQCKNFTLPGDEVQMAMFFLEAAGIEASYRELMEYMVHIGWTVVTQMLPILARKHGETGEECFTELVKGFVELKTDVG